MVGVRPQFFKEATVSCAIRAREERNYVHTGEHFDSNIFDVFFDQLDIPKSHGHLGVSDLSHGAMTVRMREGLELLIQQERPD